MKKLLPFLFAFACFTSNAQVTTLVPGQPAPDFNLKNINGKNISFKNFPKAKGYIVVFTCNTCPYAKAYEQRIIELNKKFAPAGFPVIAINPNDPDVSTADTYEKMQALAKAKHYSFPYLFDEGQVTANAYGAKATPHTFLIMKEPKANMIRYTGAIDNDTENTDPAQVRYVELAIASLLKNQPPAFAVTKAIGCTVKRKSKQ